MVGCRITYPFRARPVSTYLSCTDQATMTTKTLLLLLAVQYACAQAPAGFEPNTNTTLGVKFNSTIITPGLCSLQRVRRENLFYSRVLCRANDDFNQHKGSIPSRT